jgi:hypothetical protein
MGTVQSLFGEEALQNPPLDPPEVWRVKNGDFSIPFVKGSLQNPPLEKGHFKTLPWKRVTSKPPFFKGGQGGFPREIADFKSLEKSICFSW